MAKKSTNKCENSYLISQYYGFKGLEDLPSVSKEDLEKTEILQKKFGEDHDLSFTPVEEYAALLRRFKEKEMAKQPQPVLLYHENSIRGPHKKKAKKTGEKIVHLHVIGSPKSIAEALLIKTAHTILQEAGYTDTTVELNSVGNKDAKSAFMKELTQHYRKHINTLSGKCRELFKKGTHTLITCGTGVDEEIKKTAPQSMDFLNDESCNHLKDVLEFVESHDIPYRINNDVLGSPHYSEDTVFSIIDSETGKVLATGSRYNSLAKSVGIKEAFPSTSIAIRYVPKKKEAKQQPLAEQRPPFFFMQVGFDAKLKGLHVIDLLRKAGIPVYQSPGKDKLSSQLQVAENLKFPYILIMGHKEALENTVIVRDTVSREQIAVPIDNLAKYLKGLKVL